MSPYIISVEIDYSQGMPYFAMVGAIASEVKESKERVRSALLNSGFRLAPGRITINFSPADIRKEGTHFDLPIAIGILMAYGIIKNKSISQTLFIGELGLDGSVKAVNGILPIIIKAKEEGILNCIIPKDNYYEAIMLEGVNIVPVSFFDEVLAFINGDLVNKDMYISSYYKEVAEYDFANVHGHALARRAAEIAATGRHNLLMIGSPGAGKSMIAKCIPGILPNITEEELLEVLSIYSICGLLRDGRTVLSRPFRAPHHTVTVSGMVGGGKYPKPGEISLAHRGVLFLDELPEFSPIVIDTLRQPLEDKKLTVVRNTGSYEFDCDCMVVASMNPCKCGYYPDRSRCNCSEDEVKRYFGRVSGAILDRMDICVEVSPVGYSDLIDRHLGESSHDIHIRVEEAYERQRKRYINTDIRCNSELTAKDISSYCKLSDECVKLLERAYNNFNLTTRAYYKIIKVARTIADLDGKDNICCEHLEEAIIYRTLNTKYRG